MNFVLGVYISPRMTIWRLKMDLKEAQERINSCRQGKVAECSEALEIVRAAKVEAEEVKEPEPEPKPEPKPETEVEVKVEPETIGADDVGEVEDVL